MKYFKYNKHLTEESRKYRFLYFCFLNTKLVYVGATHLLESRLKYHGFPFNLYRCIKGTTNQINRWELKLIKKYKPINNWNGICRTGKWFRENGYLVNYHKGKILSQPIFPKINSKYKESEYNKSTYYKRDYNPRSRRGYKHKISYSKDDTLWIRDKYFSRDGKERSYKFNRQENGSYCEVRGDN